MTRSEIKPPLDLDDFRTRRGQIVKERERARREAEEEGIKEGEAEHRYRKLKAQAIAVKSCWGIESWETVFTMRQARVDLAFVYLNPPFN